MDLLPKPEGLQPALQRPADSTDAATSPFSDNPASRLEPDGPRHQPWCTAEVPLGADKCPRCGCWQLANRGALKDGRYSKGVRELLLETPEAAARVAQHRREIDTDLGSDLSRIARDLADRYVETAAFATWLGANLMAEGCLTSRGRSRAALSCSLQVLEGVC